MSAYRANNRCNVAFLTSLVEQQSGGRVASITRVADYSYEIGVVDRTKSLAALNAAIKKVIPAHLDITVIDQAMSYAAMDAFDYTEEQWDSLDLTWFEEEVYNGTPAPPAP